MSRIHAFMSVASVVFVACGGGTSADPCEGITCSGHGTCDSSSGEAVCTCDTGYQDNDGDGTCLPDCATLGLNCGLHGTCDDMSGEAVCICDDGWGGPDCSVDLVNIEWLAITGGTFMMGSDSLSSDEQPVHQVTVPSSDMSRTEVTVSHYQQCVDDGACTEPDTGGLCNWGVAGREDHPVNCVDWFQSVDFCTWVGGRLPSEAEWEYSARSGGQDITYPWGDDPANCTYAVMSEGGYGCGLGSTWPVCSKTAGNTAQGLCDMSGNVWEWVQDWHHGSYDCDANPGALGCGIGGIAPSDGGAWESPSGSIRVRRGGSFLDDAADLRAANRNLYNPSGRWAGLGCRCARSVSKELEWTQIPGGTFMMGSDSGDPDEQPVHQVAVPAFEMTNTEVTVSQYQECVDSGACTGPTQCGSHYNWGVAGRENHPVNCIDWFQAVDFCTWIGGRLPSESEWEYAARSGGQDITYPWGDDPASCTYAVMDEGRYGCGADRTWAVCSKRAGNTAQGLCDMAGNVWEWVQDWYHWDYNGAPSDGSAWEIPIYPNRVVRGGSFYLEAVFLRASNRYNAFDPTDRGSGVGFRCAR